MEEAVTHDTAHTTGAATGAASARNWRLWVMPATAVAGITLMAASTTIANA